jgi:hypothetical protein
VRERDLTALSPTVCRRVRFYRHRQGKFTLKDKQGLFGAFCAEFQKGGKYMYEVKNCLAG